MARVEMALSELTMKCGSSCRRNILSSACALRASAIARSSFVCVSAISRVLERCATKDSQSSAALQVRSEEHTSELQSLMRISYAVFCLKKKKPHLPDTYTFI